jgi:UDP-glucose:(heptosyl)LPS alpha-1,3-glucosyltransferase
MQLIFCLFTYFPYGGLQRDFINIIQKCILKGHSVKVLTMKWEGERPDGISVQEIRVRALTNHGRCMKFISKVKALLPQEKHDVVIGFNKMPCLDVYFAADPCFQARATESRSAGYRMTFRYKTFLELERSVFAPDAKTEILLISPLEQVKFIKYYRTPEDRFHLLPPGIAKNRFRPPNGEMIRREVRQEYGLADNKRLLLMVGSAFNTKGVDRSILALASLPEPIRNNAFLYVVGEGKAESFKKLASSCGVAERVSFLGGRDDVPRLLLAADLLLHPARTENTGTVLIEAMAAGLPVLATDNCGYAFHVKNADAGRLVNTPFSQKNLNLVLEQMLSILETASWKDNGVKYTNSVDVTSLHDRALDLIEKFAAQKMA